MSDYGKETVTICEIDAARCQLEYGTTNAAGTCAAQLGPEGETQGSPPVANTGTKKCYNTRVTCQDPDNYLPETQVIRFSHPQRGLTRHYGNIFPCITPGSDNPQTTPGAINLGGMDRSLSALGVREAVDIEMQDFRWNDHLLDKYRLERISGDASLEQQGTAQAGSANSLTLAADALDVAVGRQLRLTSGAGSVQRSTVSAYVGKVATVSPRWRVNLCPRSEEIDQWGDGGAAVTLNAFADPNGDMTIDTVEDDSAGSFENRSRSVAVPDDTATYVLSCLIRKDFAATHRSGFNCNITGGGGGPNQNIRFAQDGTNVAGAGLPSMTSYDDNHWLLQWSITNNGGGNTSLNFQVYPATSTTKSGSDLASAVGSLSMGWMHVRRSTDNQDYIKTEASAITLPDATTEYEVRDAFDPYERGSFWGKFLARNPYYANYRARVKHGFMGDALSSMRTRSYIVDRITGPKNGMVNIALKDLFSLIEAKKAVAPFPSQGELDAGISASDTTATLSPAGIGDTAVAEGGYASITSTVPGYVAIGSEVMKCTRSGDTLTFLDGSPPASTRGSLDTEAKEHDVEDLVQLVLNVEAELAHDIIYDLLTTYAEIPAANIDKAEWDILAASMTELYTARVADPTPVRDLIGEICEQAGCTVWHDPATDEIRFQPLRPAAANVTVNDRDWIIDGTYEQKKQDAKRVSRALVYIGQRDPTKKLDEKQNFRARVLTPDLDSEDAAQYGVQAIKEIFSRWIPQFGRTQAIATGERIIALFRDPPLEARFRIYRDRDGQLDLAQPFLLQTFETQDDTGAETPALMAPIELERGENEIGVRAQGVKFFTAPDDTGERVIHLDSPDMRNLNLRTVHDTVYAAPTGSEVVTFILPDGFTVGSTSTSSPAITTGSWPDGVTLTLDVQSGGRVQGRGGDGGNARGGFFGNQNGAPGGAGGPALKVEHQIFIDGGGEIWGGAGAGGGAGGGGQTPGGEFGGGGGGTGTNAGSGGSGSLGGGNGGPGTSEAGGGGGSGTFPGGAGGGIAQAGGAGTTSVGGGSGGAGGAAGAAINGVSLVTFDSPNLLDIRGGQIN